MSLTATVNAVITKMEESMKERLGKMAKDFSIMRTGRANPMMLESVKVEAYGSLVPLKQVAAVSVPPAPTLGNPPGDPPTPQGIEKGLPKGDGRAMPPNDGKKGPINPPVIAQERRK